MNVNFTKLNNRRVDDRGKLMKPEGFAGPEETIRAIYEGKSLYCIGAAMEFILIGIVSAFNLIHY